MLLFVIQNLKEQSLRDQKSMLYHVLQLGQIGFDSFVVCWLVLKKQYLLVLFLVIQT